MTEAHFYTVKIDQNLGGKGGTEGRVGTLYEPNNGQYPKITVQSPGEFQGPVSESGKSLNWTPEDLFVSSAAVCLFTTFVAFAEKMRVEYDKLSIQATGKLEKLPDIGNLITEIEEYVIIQVKNEDMKDKVLKALEKSEKYCLIANSMKTKVILKHEIIIKT